MKAAGEVIEVNLEELEALLERKREALGEEDFQKLKKGLHALSYLTERISDQDTTISQLRALLVKPSTEKTSKVLEQAGIKPPPPSNSPPHPNQNEKPRPGHGRNGAAAYQGAQRIKIAHGSLKPGDRCPECLQGKVYPQKDPAFRIRVVGQAPIAATVYELERLRCHLCGEVYEAEAPPQPGGEEVRRKCGGDDGVAPVWERGAVVSAGGTGSESGDSAAHLDAVRNRGGSGGRNSARIRRAAPAGGARGSLL
jgi:transposase